ncbi:MAG: hypothetical protein WA496_05360 [Candidatus Udaeobacter sp.]
MADSNEPKTETVRIDLPPPTAGNTSDPNIKEKVRIQLPLREPVGKASLPTPIPTPIPAPVAHAPDSSGLRKETVRVSGMPDSPTAQMKKTEPLIAMPDVAAQNPSIALAPGKKNSMLLIWILFGVSLLILIIQIWTYLS